MNNEERCTIQQQSPVLHEASVRRCTLIGLIELVIRISDGAKVINRDDVGKQLEVGDVYFCSVKKDGQEYEVYIA